MSKILIVSHLAQNFSGWARVAQDVVLALDGAGYDVVPRTIYLSEQNSNINPRILELEEKNDRGCDVILNIVLPHHLEYRAGYKNISLFFSETDSLPIEWVGPLNLMDEVWVVNIQMKEACLKSGITKPIQVVYPPIDTSKYERTYADYKPLKDKLAGQFSFLVVGDLQRRKNLASIIKAFHCEFSTNEPVNLVIKSTKFNTSPEQQEQIIRKMSEEIRAGLKLYPNQNDYKSEIIITDSLSDEQMMELHNTCDCLVSNSYGEALGLPLIDSMGLGKLVIANKVGWANDDLIGYNEFDLDKRYWEGISNSLTITTSEQCLEPVFGMNEGFPFLFTGKENWWQGSTTALMNRMRMAYEMSISDKEIIGKGAINTVYEYSYSTFAERVKELIN